jgi:hypothetical protein
MNTEINVSWHMTLYSPVDIYWSIGRIYCFHLQGTRPFSYPLNGGSTLIRNVRIYLRHYTATQVWRHRHRHENLYSISNERCSQPRYGIHCPSSGWSLVAIFKLRPLYTWWNSPQCPLDWRMGEPRSRFREKQNLMSLPGIDPGDITRHSAVWLMSRNLIQ